MSFGDFLKEIGDAAQYIPVIGSYVSFGEEKAGVDPEHKHAHTSAAIQSGIEASHVTPVLQSAMNGMTWLYDNGVSQPMSTAMLMGRLDDQSSVFSTAEWSKAWRAAEHISPGQAYFMDDPFGYHAPGTDRNRAQKAIDSPLTYYQPQGLAGTPAWEAMSPEEQQEYLRKQGMPAIGNQYIEQMRKDSSFFKYSSGLLDFGARWYLDPTVLGGKAAGAARMKHLVQARPAGGWSPSEIAKLVDSSKMMKARDFIFEHKDNPAVINNLSMIRKSAMGPRAASVISKLKTEDEVRDFLLVSMGDLGARARLEASNVEVATQLQRDTARIPALDLAASRVAGHNNPRAQALVDQRLTQLRGQVNANEALHQRYQGMLDHAGELDALNVTKFSGARALRRTKAQASYATGPAWQFTKNRGGFFDHGLVLARSFAEAHPTGLVKVDDLSKESIDEVRGHIARIPGLKAPERLDLINRYLRTTTEGERVDLLDEIGQEGAARIAERHGLTADDGLAIYRENRRRVGIEKAKAEQRYSAAQFPGENVMVDEFMGEGGALSVHPNMVTKLANDHVMMDLDELNKVLARHGDGLKAIRRGSGSVVDFLTNSADFFNHIWKFGTLFRMGYIPRVLSDDLAGQVARLGAATMAARAGWGVKNLATNVALRKPGKFYEAKEAVAREGIAHADGEIKLLQPQVDKLTQKLANREGVDSRSLTRARDRHRRAQNKLNALGPDAQARSIAARQRLVDKHKTAVAAAEQTLKENRVGPASKLAEQKEQLDFLKESRAGLVKEMEEAKLARQRGFRQRSQLYNEVEHRGVSAPAALSGEQGEYFGQMISSDDSLRNLFSSNKKMLHGNLQRAWRNSGRAVTYPQDNAAFVSAWEQSINHMIMQDPLAIQAVKGASSRDMSRWLTNTPEGRAYRRRVGLAMNTNDRLADSVWHEVNQYMPTPEIRAAALEGKADTEFLTEAASQGKHPFQVHTTDLSESLAGGPVSGAMDRVFDAWFKWAAAVPADKMSRHPLFNQLYEGHVKQLVDQHMQHLDELTKAGHRAEALKGKIHLRDAEDLATTARRLALRDTRKLVFDIAHRSDVGHALRFISPFYSATTEAWQRWARIIADKPQTVGYAGMFFNAPIAMGVMQDRDGNKIMRDGTVMDPVTGKRKTVPKSDRMIVTRIPKELAQSSVGKALGLDSYNKAPVLLSQDSLDLITQGDPWFVPGVGPIVQIPVNELVKDKPSQAELARHLGILPFGPETDTLFGQGPLGRGLSLATPTTVRNFLTAFDTSDTRYQRIKLHIMQKAAFEHAHNGTPMPSAKDIADMTRNYWLKSAAWSFLQPASTTRNDEYEFYRQQYRNLQRKNFKTADEQFIEKYGSDFFTFAQSSSSGSTPSTKAAVALSKRYGNLIAQNPDLAALIVGPEGKGPFSPEAYAYQLTTPLVPGGAEMQRTKLTADEAMKENEKRKGWAQFTQLMNGITSKMIAAGFNSFTDKGAENFQAQKRAIVTVLGRPTLPDGTKNPYYNEQWSKDYFQMDPIKYERLIPGLEAVASSPLAKEPKRTDLRHLQNYLQARKVITQVLAQRDAAGGAKTLSAKQNADLALVWSQFVDGLIEKDTRFGDLYHRYLSRDLGVDVETMTQDEAVI